MCALTCCNHVMISAGQFVNKLKRNSTSLEYPSLSHTDPRGTRDWLSRDSTFWARRHDHGPTTHPARTRVRGFRAHRQDASAWVCVRRQAAISVTLRRDTGTAPRVRRAAVQPSVCCGVSQGWVRVSCGCDQRVRSTRAPCCSRLGEGGCSIEIRCSRFGEGGCSVEGRCSRLGEGGCSR